jgi:hypothetical protein
VKRPIAWTPFVTGTVCIAQLQEKGDVSKLGPTSCRIGRFEDKKVAFKFPGEVGREDWRVGILLKAFVIGVSRFAVKGIVEAIELKAGMLFVSKLRTVPLTAMISTDGEYCPLRT